MATSRQPTWNVLKSVDQVQCSQCSTFGHRTEYCRQARERVAPERASMQTQQAGPVVRPMPTQQQHQQQQQQQTGQVAQLTTTVTQSSVSVLLIAPQRQPQPQFAGYIGYGAAPASGYGAAPGAYSAVAPYGYGAQIMLQAPGQQAFVAGASSVAGGYAATVTSSHASAGSGGTPPASNPASQKRRNHDNQRRRKKRARRDNSGGQTEGIDVNPADVVRLEDSRSGRIPGARPVQQMQIGQNVMTPPVTQPRQELENTERADGPAQTEDVEVKVEEDDQAGDEVKVKVEKDD